MNNNRELLEIIQLTKTARKRLQELILETEPDEECTAFDEAADALSDAVEILEEAL